MYNWAVDEKAFKRESEPETYAIWRLEQLVNFGLDGKKIPKAELKNIGSGSTSIRQGKSFCE